MFFLLLFLIGFRPFLSSLAFPFIDFLYSYAFIGLAILFIFQRKGTFLTYTKLSLFVYAFLISLSLSACLGLNFRNSIAQLYKFIFLFFVYLFIRNLNEKEKRKVIRILIISSLLVGIYSLYYLFFAAGDLLNTLKALRINYPFAFEFLKRRRTFIPFVLPSVLSCYLAIMLSITGYYIFSLKESKRNTVLLMSIFLIPMSLSFFLTKSISGILSLFLAWIAASLMSRAPRRKLLPLILAAVIITAFIYLIRTVNSADFASAGFSFGRRIIYWKEALSYILKHPFRPAGPGNYWGSYSQYVHNSYLQVWVEAGLLGIISLAGIIYTSVKNILRNGSAWNKLIFPACLVFLFHNLFDFSFFLPEVSFIWWIILAMTE